MPRLAFWQSDRQTDIWALTPAQPLRQEEVPSEVSKPFPLGVSALLVLPRWSERACSESDLRVARLWKHSGGSPEWLVLEANFRAIPAG